MEDGNPQPPAAAGRVLIAPAGTPPTHLDERWVDLGAADSGGLRFDPEDDPVDVRAFGRQEVVRTVSVPLRVREPAELAGLYLNGAIGHPVLQHPGDVVAILGREPVGRLPRVVVHREGASSILLSPGMIAMSWRRDGRVALVVSTETPEQYAARVRRERAAAWAAHGCRRAHLAYARRRGRGWKPRR